MVYVISSRGRAKLSTTRHSDLPTSNVKGLTYSPIASQEVLQHESKPVSYTDGEYRRWRSRWLGGSRNIVLETELHRYGKLAGLSCYTSIIILFKGGGSFGKVYKG